MIELPDKQLFRPDEVADIFSISKRTVYTWLDNGTLTGVKIAGTTVRVDRESIEGVISVIE
jgi:excisionase family DNA binding protein